MLLRRSRKHLHGASNRTLSGKQFQPTRTHSTLPVETTIKPITNTHPATSFLKKRQFVDRKVHITEGDQQTGQKPQGIRNTETQLRKKYRGCKNIVKVLNRWGFTAKGCITRDEFREQVKRKTGIDIKDQQMDQLLIKHCNGTQSMNAQGLITLIFGKTEGVPFDHRTFSTDQNNQVRDKLVDNLKENLKNFDKVQKRELNDNTLNTLISKVNSGISKMKQINDGTMSDTKTAFFNQLKRLNNFNNFEKEMLGRIESGVNYQQMRNLLHFNKNVDYLMADPILRNIRQNPRQSVDICQSNNRTTQYNQSYMNQMKSSPNLFTTVFRNEDKRKPFDPTTFYHINQRKTRFGRSNFTGESSGWTSNYSSQTVYPNQKQTIVNELRRQQEIGKTRYQNRLNNMRVWRSKQFQNIAAKETEAERREEGRLHRMRDQQQAYSYINFIKKKWE